MTSVMAGRATPSAWTAPHTAGGAWARPSAPVALLPTAHCVQHTLSWQAAAFVLIAAQVFLVSAFGSAMLLIGTASLVMLYCYYPLTAVTVFLQVLLYGNLFLSIFSGYGFDATSLQMVQGLPFAMLAGCAAVAAVRIVRSQPTPLTVRLVRWTCLSLAVIVVYTLYGAMRSSPTSALIYFRNTSAMLLALLVGLDVGGRWGYRTIATIYITSLAIGLLLAVAEYFLPSIYYTAIDAADFVRIKKLSAGGSDLPISVADIIATRTVTWFNITGGAGDALSVRLYGSNMFPISYAYVLAVGGIAASSLGLVGVTILALGLLLIAGIKGALILFSATLLLTLIWFIFRRPAMVLAASAIFFIAYIALGIRFGLAHGDFHVIGFLGGVSGFMKMPWGHGIGVGGNLSAAAVQGLDWETWQKLGVDFALESAVGVLIYQMGIAALAVYAPILLLLRSHFRPARQARERAAFKPRAVDALFISIAAVLANGVFQEEAYSPYALGLLTLLGGVMASNAGRPSPSQGGPLR